MLVLHLLRYRADGIDQTFGLRGKRTPAPIVLSVALDLLGCHSRIVVWSSARVLSTLSLAEVRGHGTDAVMGRMELIAPASSAFQTCHLGCHVTICLIETGLSDVGPILQVGGREALRLSGVVMLAGIPVANLRLGSGLWLDLLLLT